MLENTGLFRRLGFWFFLALVLGMGLTCFASDEDKPVRALPREPSPLERLAGSLSEGGLLPSRHRLIVLTFTNGDGTRNPYGAILAEKLTTELVKKNRFLVLDRMVHEKILKERELSLESDQNLATLRKIGESLKLDYIVTGIVSPYQEGVFVNCRLIDLKSGLISKAEEVFVFTDG